MSGNSARIGSEREKTPLTEDDILEKYAQEVAPMLQVSCIIAGPQGVPSQLYAESRAIVSHLSRTVSVSGEGSDELIEKNLVRASRHLERCAVDCRKWLCIYYCDEGKKRLSKLKRCCDLSLVRDGLYLKAIREKQTEADCLFCEAKREEAWGGENVMGSYDQAVLAYEKFFNLIDRPDSISFDTNEAEVPVSERLNELTKRTSREKAARIIILVLSIIVAIAGLVVNFM